MSSLIRGNLIPSLISSVTLFLLFFHYFGLGPTHLSDVEFRGITFLIFTGVSLTYFFKRIPSYIKIVIFIFAILSIFRFITFYYEYESVVYATSYDFILGLVTIGLITFLTTSLSKTISIISLISIILIPYLLGIDFVYLINMSYLSLNGVFGDLYKMAITFIYLFLIYGALMASSGIDKLFLAISRPLSRIKGGPANISVFSSASVAMIQGSAVSNVATTGSFTIPLMKKFGFKPHDAAAVESAASTGGIITPPIMGAVAFIMSEITGIPYIEICIASAIPAIMYYIPLIISIRVMGIKMHSSSTRFEEIEELKVGKLESLKILIPIFTSLGILVYLLSSYHAITYSAFLALFSFILLYLLMNPKDIKSLVIGMSNGIKPAAELAITFACLSIIITSVSATGLSVKLHGVLIEIAKISLILVPMVIAILTTLTGMVVSITACYLLLASFVGPTLSALGIPPMAAHLFLIWACLYSGFTPPVAIVSQTAASIANADSLKTMLKSMSLCFHVYIISFLIIFRPEIVIGTIEERLILMVYGIITSVSFILFVENYFIEHCNIYERVMLGILFGSLIIQMVMYIPIALIIGGLSFGFLLFSQMKRKLQSSHKS